MIQYEPLEAVTPNDQKDPNNESWAIVTPVACTVNDVRMIKKIKESERKAFTISRPCPAVECRRRSVGEILSETSRIRFPLTHDGTIEVRK